MVRDTNELVTIFLSLLARGRIGRTIVESEISDVMITLELLQHVVSADLPALINRMK